MAVVRALPARAPQGRFYLRHRRFFFLGIMLGVATLIIVMAVMNGFRKELLDKILGLNGHLLGTAAGIAADDWKDVAERISQVDGIRLAAPVVDGQALASSASNASGVLVARHALGRPEQPHLDRQEHQARHDGRVRRGAGRHYRTPPCRSIVAACGDTITLVAPKAR